MGNYVDRSPLDGGAGCNTRIILLCCSLELQGFTWPFIQLTRHGIEFCLRVYRQVGAFGKMLSQQPIGVLIGTPLPRTGGIAKIDLGNVWLSARNVAGALGRAGDALLQRGIR